MELLQALGAWTSENSWLTFGLACVAAVAFIIYLDVKYNPDGDWR